MGLIKYAAIFILSFSTCNSFGLRDIKYTYCSDQADVVTSTIRYHQIEQEQISFKQEQISNHKISSWLVGTWLGQTGYKINNKNYWLKLVITKSELNESLLQL